MLESVIEARNAAINKAVKAKRIFYLRLMNIMFTPVIGY